QFSEEDLTRYLQLSLDIFTDLQASLQPRFHLELGLLRMVQAGRLLPIEEALAGLGGGGGGVETQKREPAAAPKAAPKAAPVKNTAPNNAVPAPVAAAQPAATGSWRDRLHAALMQSGMAFTADAIEHSEIVEVNGELRFTTPRDFSLAMREADIHQAVRQVAGKPLKIRITIGDAGAQEPVAPVAREDDVSRRALAHPEVQRFRELFGGEVRTVRNLKEST
ncbi:MAG TPA: hypothetical protein VKR61_23225, partial [Bryobacteraceae bacterium]|nr:hypothetical protein [Bryobacteraceae bacterium]